MEKECVLLGRKVDIHTRKESEGISTWVDKDHLSLIEETKPFVAKDRKLYHVQVGAFSKKEKADAFMEKRTKAGFTCYLKYE